jgi:hypothetical protein
MSATAKASIPASAIGQCHCAAIRFRVLLDHRRIVECNCSICAMRGYLHYIVPEADVEFLAGKDTLQTYTFNTHTAQHYFCAKCGIAPIYRPRSHPDDYSVNFRCLDLAPAQRAQFACEPFDGANWEAAIDGLRDSEKSNG